MAKLIHNQNFIFETRGKEFHFKLETLEKAKDWRDRVEIDTRIGTLWLANCNMIHIKVKNPKDTVKIWVWNGPYVSGKEFLCAYEPDQRERRLKFYLVRSPAFFNDKIWKDDHPKRTQATFATNDQDMQLSELDRHAMQGSIDPRDLAAITTAMNVESDAEE